MSSVTIKSPESLRQYTIDPVLKRYFRTFLEGAEVPGLENPKREIIVSILKPMFHKGGLEVQLEDSSRWPRPDKPNEFSPFGDSDYVISLGPYTIRGKKIPDIGKEVVRVETRIVEQYAPATPEREGVGFIKVPYSVEEDSVIHYILEHFKLMRDRSHPNSIQDPWNDFGFRPHSLKKLDDSFERLHLASSIINDFLERHEAIAKAAIAKRLKKYKRK